MTAPVTSPTTPTRFAGLRRLLRDQSGQALPMMLLSSVLFIGLGGITLDLGKAFVVKRQLQGSTDAAALAAAYALAQPNATVTTVKAAASSYSSASGDANASSYMPGATITTTPECLTAVANWGIVCAASPTGYNAVQVVQTAPVNSLFIRVLTMFGANPASSLSVTAESTAAMRGATNAQYNVAIIIDTTNSMGQNDTDANCGHTRIYCALQSVQTLLQSLSPCSSSSTSSSCSPFDQVAMFTFPNVSASVSTDKTSYSTQDTVCPTSNPSIPYYSTPSSGATWAAPTSNNPTYQITSFLSNYSSTNQAGAALNAASALAIAAGASGKSNCSGLQTPGGDGTYLAGSIYAAQSALVAAQKNNPGSLNAMIILTDGASNTSKMTGGQHNGNTYPSLDDQCQQSISAAKAASAANTTVYTVAYGASTAANGTQCTTDPSLSPCTELQDMATTTADFFSDATASQNKGQCTSSANPNLNLQGIFKQISSTFTVARLIPNGTT